MRVRKHRAESTFGLTLSGLSARAPRELVEDGAPETDRVVAKVAIFAHGCLCLGQRNDTGKWTLPGGHADPGEEPLQAAIREVAEETGLEVTEDNLMSLGAPKLVTKPDGTTIMVHGFRCDLGPDARPDTSEDPDAEVTVWHWINVEHGLPDDIAANMHVEPKDDVVMQGLGLAPKDEDCGCGGDDEAVEPTNEDVLGLFGLSEDKDPEVDDDGGEYVDEDEYPEQPAEKPARASSYTGVSKRMFKALDDLKDKAGQNGHQDVVSALSGAEDSYWEVQKAIMRAASGRKTEDVEGMVDGMLDEMRTSQAILEAEAKDGEGSRGGKVIGHTGSGKPIYASARHPEHKKFSKDDHVDAAQAHHGAVERLSREHHAQKNSDGTVSKKHVAAKKRIAKDVVKHREQAAHHADKADPGQRSPDQRDFDRMDRKNDPQKRSKASGRR